MALFTYMVVILVCMSISQNMITVIRTGSYTDKVINKRLKLFRANQIFGVAIIAIVSLLMLYVNVTGGMTSDFYKTANTIISELSIFVLVIAALTLLLMNNFTRKSFTIINYIFAILSVVNALAYLITPFVLATFFAKQAMNNSIMIYIMGSFWILLFVMFFYLLFTFVESFFLSDKISIVALYIRKNKKNENINERLRKSIEEKRWLMPILFDKEKVEKNMNNAALFNLMMEKKSAAN